MQLTGIDHLIIVAYFAIVLVVGLACSSRAGKSLADYFVSGRQLPWWLAGTSMVATTFAADTPLAVTELVVRQGIAGNWFWWAFALSGTLTVFLFAKLWRRSEVLTDVELIELRYAGRPAALLRGFRAIYVAVIVNSVIIAWVTKAMLTILHETLPSTVLQGETGDYVDWVVIALLLGMVGIYSTLSGMWGVALTDAIQFTVAMAGCVVLAVVAVGHVGGIDALKQRVVDLAGAEHLYYLPTFRENQSGLPWQTFALLIGVQWWATWFPAAEPGGGGYVVQRMNACRNERHAVWATLWFQLAHYCVRPWPWILVALVAMVMHPQLLDPNFKEPGVGFVWVMKEVAPPGLRGLLLAAFFAAYMSTISTQMNWGASYLVRDLYQRFLEPSASQLRLVAASRWASLIVLALGGIASVLLRDMSIPDLWRMLAALGAGTGLVFMLRWLWWRVTAWTEIAAMVFSLAFFTIVNWQKARLSAAIGASLDDTAVMAIVAALTVCGALGVTLGLPSERMETLSRFYCKVRPPRSGWRHVAARHPEVQAERHTGLALLLSLLSAVMIYATIPAVGYWIFGEVKQAALCTLLAAAAGGGVFVGLNRLLADEPAAR